MNILHCLGFIALGMILDALYHRWRRLGERQAYFEGYRQGKYEENLRATARNQCAQPYETKHAKYSLPESFAKDFNEHGRAITKIGGANNG